MKYPSQLSNKNKLEITNQQLQSKISDLEQNLSAKEINSIAANETIKFLEERLSEAENLMNKMIYEFKARERELVVANANSTYLELKLTEAENQITKIKEETMAQKREPKIAKNNFLELEIENIKKVMKEKK